MPFWRCSIGILRRPSSAYVSGGGQTQSLFGTIAARSIRRFGTIFPTSVMVIALPSAAINLFDNVLFSTPASGSAKAVREQSRINQLWRRYSPSPATRGDYILPAFMSATRFSKAEVLAFSALPFARAASPTLSASSFLPAAQRMFVLADRFRNVSLTLIDWSTNFSASSQFLSLA